MVRKSFCFVFVLVLLLTSGCKTDTLKDTVTKEELDVLRDPPSSLEKVTINSDSMLNDSSYNPMLMKNNVFLDKSYYQNHIIARGDIVMYKTGNISMPFDFGRIIGLSDEEVHLMDGHIYIDGKKLDAFYSSEFRGETRYEKDSTSLERPVVLREGEYFVLGDYWQRSFNDSQTIGPIINSDIYGKVVGWEGPKIAWDYQQGIIVGIESNRVAIVRKVSANALRGRSTVEIMGMAYPEALWVIVDQNLEIQALKIGDTVNYELTGEFKRTNPFQAKGKNFERTGNIFEQETNK